MPPIINGLNLIIKPEMNVGSAARVSYRNHITGQENKQNYCRKRKSYPRPGIKYPGISMYLFFASFHETINKWNKNTWYCKEPDIPGIGNAGEFKKQVFCKAAEKYQPSPKEEMETTLTDIHFGFINHISDDLKALFACHLFFFVFHNNV